MTTESDNVVVTELAPVANPTVAQVPAMPTAVPISVSPGEKTREVQNYVMNGLADSLYNVYSDKKTAKELWESLDRKYKTEDAGAKKFVVGRFLDYKMVDSKTVVIKSKNFNSKAKTNNNKGKGSKLGLKEGSQRSRNFKGNASIVVSKVTTVVSEVNLVGSNPKEWWIDTGATRHVCSDKKMFSTFEPIENGEKVFMGNSATSEIKGQGKVILKMDFWERVDSDQCFICTGNSQELGVWFIAE
ncbi:hypothetical protein CK203_005258 [Vitis vinifera]|uniref:Retrovirus-related Pol polyprotein from transposon TNT 1-94-like beta-barrel domain-containing protein n=1 Tax=Vitis vinifera TaxID=29760 RepID=A0A438KF40_VITVI|nr:hypothetical protein CK203_005258 [Vitis vinifera]